MTKSNKSIDLVLAAATCFAAFAATAATGVAVWQASILQKQVRIAADQLAVVKDTELRQLRAYLSIVHSPLIVSNPTYGADLIIRHAGQTPAYKVKLNGFIEIGPYLLNQTTLRIPTNSIEHEYAILYGGDPIRVNISNSFEPTALRLVTNTDPLIGDHRFYLHGVVHYLDIFGINDPSLERRYEFCFVFHPERDPEGSEKGCEQYNKPG